jgi:hypothetical protein
MGSPPLPKPAARQQRPDRRTPRPAATYSCRHAPYRITLTWAQVFSVSVLINVRLVATGGARGAAISASCNPSRVGGSERSNQLAMDPPHRSPCGAGRDPYINLLRPSTLEKRLAVAAGCTATGHHQKAAAAPSMGFPKAVAAPFIGLRASCSRSLSSKWPGRLVCSKLCRRAP